MLGLVLGTVLGSAAADAQNPPGLQVVHEGPHAPYLADALGRPLYLFTADRRGSTDDPPRSRCESECLAAWPAFTSDRPPELGAGVDASRIGMLERPAGATQVTYAGWPLYLFAKDEPGRVRGQDVHAFGGGWYLLRPDGSKVEEEDEGEAE